MIIIGFLSFLGYELYTKVRRQQESVTQLKTLPKLPFTFLKKRNNNNNKSVLIMFFSPDCDHCQFMLQEISKNQQYFDRIEVLAITTASKKEVLFFINNFSLAKASFLNFGLDINNDFVKIFDVTITPTFYLYDSKHNFVKRIVGQTKIEHLLNER